ncbi:glycosyltransferase family 4 protein [Streptomyces anulatus]|uniref:glycosyltransferase family 4 protein n=1 Tax=Streptomyces anulatus TaxID=1892 RepID=UPI00333134EA
MTVKPLTILTGINRTAEPSSGSLILVNDLYPAMPDTRTIYLGRRPVDQEWRSAFDRLIPISTTKRPLGPGFDTYVDELTQEVGALIEQLRPDAIHAQNVGFALSLAFSRTAGTIPMISITHGPEVMAAERNATEHAAMLEVAAASSAIVTPTPVLAGHIDRLTGRRFTDRIAVIPWGIRLADAVARDQPSTGTGPLSLVHASRLDDNKSTITAVKALALTDQPHSLTVIGKGDLREHLEQRAVELGLRGRVHFERHMPRAELWSRLPSFDAFVFTTKDLEAFGLVLIEAQAHGLPVVYSALPGVKDILGNAGSPYNPGDPHSLASTLDKMAGDFHLRKALTTASLINARRYDITTTGRRFRELTLRVIS